MDAEAAAPTVETRVLTPRVPPKDIVATASLERGRGPRPGVYRPAFHWADLVDGPPPRRLMHGEGAYVVYLGMDVDWDARITYSTVVTVDPGVDPHDPADDIVHVDERMGVKKRALLELMDAEREFTDRVTSKWRERLGRRLARQRQAVNRIKVPWLIRLAVRFIRLEAKVGMGTIRGTRRFMRSLVQMPDAMVSRIIRAQANLSGRLDRRSMWKGLSDPHTLTNEQKSVVLFLSTMTIVAVAVLLLDVIALAFPQYAAAYRSFLGDATAVILGTLVLPLPLELQLIASTIATGATLAFAGFFIGKMLGAWLLYFLGDALHSTVEGATATRPRLKRLVDWMHDNSDRYGFFLLIPVNAIPFVPDALLAVFALSGMQFKRYMGGIAIGSAIKYGGIIAAVVFIGPDRVTEFVTNPFG